MMGAVGKGAAVAMGAVGREGAGCTVMMGAVGKGAAVAMGAVGRGFVGELTFVTTGDVGTVGICRGGSVMVGTPAGVGSGTGGIVVDGISIRGGREFGGSKVGREAGRVETGGTDSGGTDTGGTDIGGDRTGGMVGSATGISTGSSLGSKVIASRIPRRYVPFCCDSSSSCCSMRR